MTGGWRKSSYSYANGSCVLIGQVTGAVAVRDSKDPDGPVLAFPEPAWGTFLAGVKAARQ